jgi:hypothetical protein
MKGCGYGTNLVQDDFHYAADRPVKLAAFSHLPLDARSACIAAIDCQTNDLKAEVLQQRKFGSPLVFVSFRYKIQLWKPGTNDAECLETGLTARQLNGFFAEHEANLAPGRIYKAKTLEASLAAVANSIGSWISGCFRPLSTSSVPGSPTLSPMR